MSALAVSAGATLAGLTDLGSDSDSNVSGSCGTRARVECLAEAGTTYRDRGGRGRRRSRGMLTSAGPDKDKFKVVD